MMKKRNGGLNNKRRNNAYCCPYEFRIKVFVPIGDLPIHGQSLRNIVFSDGFFQHLLSGTNCVFFDTLVVLGDGSWIYQN